MPNDDPMRLGAPKQRFQEPTIKQNKNGSWYIRPWIDVLTASGIERKKKTIVLGPPEIGKRGAIQKKNEVMSSINNGDYLGPSQITMDMLLGEYQKHIDKLSSGTRVMYESIINAHVKPAFGSKTIGQINTKVIQDWIDSKPDLCWNSKTNLRNVISGIFTKAEEWGYWKQRNPARFVYVGRKTKKREKRKLTDAETTKLLQELNPMPRLACMIGLFTTLRISEILALQEKHLNFKTEEIEVVQRYYRGNIDNTKSDTSTRKVTMGSLSGWLRDVCVGDPNHYIVQSHKNCRTYQNLLRTHLKPAAVRLGLHYEGFGFHALRREAITEIGKQIGIQAIMNMAGHTHMDLSLLYTLTDTDAQKVASASYMQRIVQRTVQ